MSYVALVTDRFDAVTHFYGDVLGCPVVAAWDRPTGRGKRFDLAGGLRLEVLDNRRERSPLRLGDAGDRLQIVVEVPDIDAAHARVSAATPAPPPQDVSWGARLFPVRDPDGVTVTFLQWNDAGDDQGRDDRRV